MLTWRLMRMPETTRMMSLEPREQAQTLQLWDWVLLSPWQVRSVNMFVGDGNWNISVVRTSDASRTAARSADGGRGRDAWHGRDHAACAHTWAPTTLPYTGVSIVILMVTLTRARLTCTDNIVRSNVPGQLDTSSQGLRYRLCDPIGCQADDCCPPIGWHSTAFWLANAWVHSPVIAMHAILQSCRFDRVIILLSTHTTFGPNLSVPQSQPSQLTIPTIAGSRMAW